MKFYLPIHISLKLYVWQKITATRPQERNEDRGQMWALPRIREQVTESLLAGSLVFTRACIENRGACLQSRKGEQALNIGKLVSVSCLREQAFQNREKMRAFKNVYADLDI